MTATHTQGAKVTERRMDVGLTVGEIQALYLLAIRERHRTQDQDPEMVNLARKLTEYRRLAIS